MFFESFMTRISIWSIYIAVICKNESQTKKCNIKQGLETWNRIKTIQFRNRLLNYNLYTETRT